MVNSAQSISRSGGMATLAKAPLALLEERCATLEAIPQYEFLRSPEIGLAMVRGRTEGTGQPFNLGEMTLTRCVVRLEGPNSEEIAGFGYVAGRSQRHAELAALCDALLQHPDWRERVQTQVITPLLAAAQNRQAQAVAQAEATRVNFLTLKRGES